MIRLVPFQIFYSNLWFPLYFELCLWMAYPGSDWGGTFLIFIAVSAQYINIKTADVKYFTIHHPTCFGRKWVRKTRDQHKCIWIPIKEVFISASNMARRKFLNSSILNIIIIKINILKVGIYWCICISSGWKWLFLDFIVDLFPELSVIRGCLSVWSFLP